MAHGYAWGVYTDQRGRAATTWRSSPRWRCSPAERDLGGGAHLQLRSMLSLEPLMGARGYPNLFATGETADGQPLVDRQHPHDLFMELAARLDIDVGGGDSAVRLWRAGRPSRRWGHRRSCTAARRAISRWRRSRTTGSTARTSPMASSTAGYAATAAFQLEGIGVPRARARRASLGYRNAQARRWSVRATWTPSPALGDRRSSHGRLESPKRCIPARTRRAPPPASNMPTAASGDDLRLRAKHRIAGRTLTAWLAEANWDLTRRHTLFGRIENVANDELFPDPADPLHDRAFRVTRFEGWAMPIGCRVGPVRAGAGRRCRCLWQAGRARCRLWRRAVRLHPVRQAFARALGPRIRRARMMDERAMRWYSKARRRWRLAGVLQACAATPPRRPSGAMPIAEQQARR